MYIPAPQGRQSLKLRRRFAALGNRPISKFLRGGESLPCERLQYVIQQSRLSIALKYRVLFAIVVIQSGRHE